MPEIDAGWLTDALRRSLGTDATVVSFAATSIGTGQVGENLRIAVTWDDDAGLPASVVAKLPSVSEVSRATAVQLGTYVREIGFYRDVQRHVAIRTPRLHAMEWDPATHDFVLLMEDVAPATSGDQLVGGTLRQAELAVDEAVHLHAPTWGRVAALEAPWMSGVATPQDVAIRAELFRLLAPGFVDRYVGRLPPDDLALTERLVAAYPEWHAGMRAWGEANGWCVTHGDYRLDNMLFGEPPASPALTVVDWQTVAVGVGPADIAYFCGAGLSPSERVRHERSLAVRYAAGLRAAGIAVEDDTVWEGYVIGAVTGLYMAVLASQVVERTARGDEMFAVMAERHLDQVRTVGLLDRLV